MAQSTQSQFNKKAPQSFLLWILAGVLLIGLLLARVIYPEFLGLTLITGIPLLGIFVALIVQNQKALKSRTATYGVSSFVTSLLIIGIIGVLDFLASRYPKKFDLTKNKIHTISDTSVKLLKSLQKPVHVTLYSKFSQRDQLRPLLENFSGINPKFELQYIDPDKEPTRAREAGVKKYGTLVLRAGERESKVEEPTEEKLTNALIKILKEKTTTFCALTGHGEKVLTSNEADGYEVVRKALIDQAYEVKSINLVQDHVGSVGNLKIPEFCDGIAVLGAQRSFFEPEVQAIRSYLAEGGRALFAIDMNLKGPEYAPELNSVLSDWYVQSAPALIVDPVSRMLGVDASVAVLASFSREQIITKDFQSNCFFPFSRPLKIMSGVPTSLHVEWIAQTTPKSWAVTELKQLATGEVRYREGKDEQGPLSVAVTVEGKLHQSKAARSTRLVVFGTSFFATNNFSRYGGNLDFFLNAASWVMEDESLISIRPKDEAAGQVELSQKSGAFIFMLTVIIVPLVIAATGLMIWIVRRRM